jgi:hypothetical protein
MSLPDSASPAPLGARGAAAAPRAAPELATGGRRDWAVACLVAASTAVSLGVHWDIAWHRSIGRDTFWSPPHVLIYLAAIGAGGIAAGLIFRTTFSRDPDRRGAAVTVLGFRGPLGAFVAAWGGAAMLTSAPFDDWWHNAYGLDVKILSPPHVLLAIGILGIHLGALVFVLVERNVAEGARRRALDRLFLYVTGMVLVALTTVVMERIGRPSMHLPGFFRVVALVAPGPLCLAGAGSDRRWAATAVATVYTLFLCLLVWTLPLFPAEPKLGPVLYPVVAFVPPELPLLLIVPALALDLARRSSALGRLAPFGRALVMGGLFVAVFVPAQWIFAELLMSPLGRSRFLGTTFFDFRMPAEGLYRRYLFIRAPGGLHAGALVAGLAAAGLCAVVTSWLGLRAGAWARRLCR